MLEKVQAYDIKFIQKASPTLRDAFNFCRVYRFYTDPIPTCQRLKYIIRAEAHDKVFAIKFYAARDKKLDNKYNRTLGVYDYTSALRIFVTCASLIPELMKDFPEYSYIVNGARTIDINKKIESESETQRFRVYRALATKIIGTSLFEHYQFKEISSYLLVRKQPNIDTEEEKNKIKQMFLDRYNIEDI